MAKARVTSHAGLRCGHDGMAHNGGGHYSPPTTELWPGALRPCAETAQPQQCCLVLLRLATTTKEQVFSWLRRRSSGGVVVARLARAAPSPIGRGR